MKTAFLSVSDLVREYSSGSATLRVLDRVSFEVAEGESVALMGQSGAGKTTLLYLLGGLDRPTSGTVRYGDQELTALSGDQLADFRNRMMGFVWQQSSLLPEFTARENVEMPLRIRGVAPAEAARRASEALEEVGLADRGHHRAGELSGGEQQRVALARALAVNPRVLLADEPTGNLDNQTGARIIQLIEDLRRTRNLTTLIVTHNPELAGRCDRTFVLSNGRLSGTTMEGTSHV